MELEFEYFIKVGCSLLVKEITPESQNSSNKSILEFQTFTRGFGNFIKFLLV